MIFSVIFTFSANFMFIFIKINIFINHVKTADSTTFYTYIDSLVIFQFFIFTTWFILLYASIILQKGQVNIRTCAFFTRYISTWRYENRLSKHFVIFLNFHCLIAWHVFTVLLAYVVFFFACFEVRDLCRSGCRQNYNLTPLHPSRFFPYPQFFVTVIWNQRTPKAGFGAV